jgi:hypothetical protein
MKPFSHSARRWGWAAALVLLTSLANASPASANILAFTINDRASLSADRTQVIVTGTIVATPGESLSVSGQIIQVQGREFASTGLGTALLTADGSVQTWMVVLMAAPGQKLKPGPATTNFFASSSSGPMVFLRGRVGLH